MAIQLSTTVRNARLDQMETTIGVSPTLKIFAGAEPANCAAADPTGPLLSIALPADWMAGASAGTKSKLGTWSGSASGTGTAQSYRVYDSGAVCHLQGSCSLAGGGGDMILDNTNIQSGQVITVNAYSWTEANS